MWIDFIDSVYFTIFYPITLIVSVLIGYSITRRLYIKKGKPWKASGVETSVIAIFALLLSFTFLSSNNSMKSRVDIMHETTDAAANLRRQSLLTDDTVKAATKEYLMNYLEIMHDFKKHYLKGEDELIRDIETVNGNYLTEITAIGKSSAAEKEEVLRLMPYFNELNSHFYRILSSYNERTPHLIIILLIVSSWLIGVLVGFLNGFHEERHYLVPFIFLVLVTLCIQTIRDLDNPYNGTIQPKFEDFGKQRDILIHSTR
ncbi:MAG TPA: hypothetical protein VKT28_16430 [Puia sp.]|nr:hypothetical protein [Puia sp.]